VERDQLCYMPAVEVAAAIRERKLSPVEVVEAVLAHIERLNPRLNAYCTVTAEGARAAARAAEEAVMAGRPLGPLHGVPVSIKDLVTTKGVRTTWGSKLHEHVVPEEDAPVVARLKAAGAIVLGKTNTPEYGWTAETDNRVFGPTRNPWDPARSAGGSSGGAAAAVAGQVRRRISRDQAGDSGAFQLCGSLLLGGRGVGCGGLSQGQRDGVVPDYRVHRDGAGGGAVQ